ncbi:hypothetical protein R8Z50_30320 [Longispora sp. K20-0274]|uniref:hypothetical protein n=1 Tax=Longispora sp. K20-0274 TaxID=3088255 RepID=UPI00399A3FFF
MKTTRPAPASTESGHPRAARAVYYTIAVVVSVGLGVVVAGALSDYNKPLRITSQIATTVALLGLAGFFSDAIFARLHRRSSDGPSS